MNDRERIARLEVRLDQVIEKLAALEGRLRRLEHALWLMTGFASAAVAIATLLTR